MSDQNKTFPLQYFIQSIRSRLFYITLTAGIISIIHQNYTEDLYQKIFTALIVLWIFSITLSFWRIKPLSKVLTRLKKMDLKLAHSQQVQLLYQKNEWEIIGEMLDFIEREIFDQKSQIENEILKAKRVFASVPSAIVVVDKFQNILQSNKEFKTIFNTSDSEESKLWKVIEDSQLLEKLEGSITANTQTQVRGFYNDKTSQFYDIKFSPLNDSTNSIIGAIGIFHNVSQAKLTEKMRVDFVANVSHEIRTPLTSIKGYAQLLQAQKETLSTTQLMLTEKINNNVEKLTELFQNLIQLSKIETNQDINKKSVPILQILDRVKSDIGVKYDKVVTFSQNIQTSELFVDTILFEQVLSNLIENAFKYGPKSLKITINTFTQDSIDYIQICDNGPGISSTDLERIFERFYRVQGENNKAIEGSGLGLSIVKHIINKHDGEIKVTSEINHGACFTISIPNQ